jgi:hypothetical protein
MLWFQGNLISYGRIWQNGWKKIKLAAIFKMDADQKGPN